MKGEWQQNKASLLLQIDNSLSRGLVNQEGARLKCSVDVDSNCSVAVSTHPQMSDNL